MKFIRSAILYIALALVANPGIGGTAELEGLRKGTLKKLVFSEPRPMADDEFVDLDGGAHRLSDWQGKYLLVNFWATWCAPCRAEMPALDALQGEFGGDDFEVVTIAIRSKTTGMTKFFEEQGIENLPLFIDEGQQLSRNSGVLGLPISVLVDPEGNEIGRLQGDAEWYSDSARAIIAAFMAEPDS